MKFTELELEQFLAIKEGKINLADRGLVLIQGENNDDTSAVSNGAGKSSLADGVCWCLFGVTARGVTGDAVINEVAGKGCRVQLTINDDGAIYKIARHRKHKTGKNSLTVHHLPTTIGATWQDLTKGTDKLTQDVVEKILGCSLDVFVGSIYAGQEKMPDLPGMTDKGLKMLIEEASGMTLLEDAYAEARERLAKLKISTDQLQNAVTRAGERHAQTATDILRVQTQQADWGGQRTARLTTLVKQVKLAIENMKSTDTALSNYASPADLEADIKAIDDKIAAVDHENTELQEHHTLVAQANAKVQRLTGDLTTAGNRVKARKADVEQVQHKVGCACNECGREITVNEIAAAETAATNALRTEVATYREIKSGLESAQNELEKLTSARDAFKASMTDLSTAIAQRSDLQRKLKAIRELEATSKSYREEATRVGEEAKRVKAEVNPYDAELERLQKLLAEQLEAIQKAEKDLEDATTDLGQAEAVTKVFSPAGVRAHILDEVTPYLNERTAHYLTTLSDGNIQATWTTLVPNAKGELKEKFTIEVTNDKGAQSFAGLSGGEKRKVRVATALALQDLVSTRALKPIELFIGDEIDHALDEPGLERLTQILEEKASERGSVFVISHNSLSDWISQIVTVKKTGSQAVIEESVV